MSFPTATPGMVRWCALVVAVFCAIAAMLSALALIDAHRTGAALYRPNPRSPVDVRVAKAESPKEFAEAIRLQSFNIFAPGSIALVTFWFSRRLSQ